MVGLADAEGVLQNGALCGTIASPQSGQRKHFTPDFVDQQGLQFVPVKQGMRGFRRGEKLRGIRELANS
jgi:hypothetical protein